MKCPHHQRKNVIIIIIISSILQELVLFTNAALQSAVDQSSSPKSKNNCSNCHLVPGMEVKVNLLPSNGASKDGDMQKYSGDEKSSQDPGVKISVPDNYHQWKTNIIIGCTVAAAIEVVIVIVIIAYWKEIRWTLRKLSCPCESESSDRGQHEPMDRSDPEPSSSGIYGNWSSDVEGQHGGREVRTYSAATTPVEHLDIEEMIDTTAV